MAENKVVNTTQLEADLTAVADAVRAKAESSDALSFPSGFVDAIANLETGGGLPSNISMIASGTITPTSAVSYFNIEHMAGVKPNFYLVRSQEAITQNTSNRYKIVYVAGTDFNGQSAGMVCYVNGSSLNSSVVNTFSASIHTCMTPAISNYSFVVGNTYHWIVGTFVEQ